MKLNAIMNGGIRNVVKTAKRFYSHDSAGKAFLSGTISSFRAGAKRRKQNGKSGLHIPPFLIASVASECNLRCSGCYARANGVCSSEKSGSELTAVQWRRIFSEAESLGISFILLAGGEPLIKKELIELAAQFPSILFPVFTNGTLINGEYIELFDRCRNLIPVLSIEGGEEITNARRGQGVYDKIQTAAAKLKARNILFGNSITVTTENMSSVTNAEFLESLRSSGCGLLFFVEYVPAQKGTEKLMLTSDDLAALQNTINTQRKNKKFRDMIMLSFPGDEEKLGGCLAAGRGFFHINANGAAEPCPFSPYSELNLKEHTLTQVLESDFFKRVQKLSAAQALNHQGGCTLFRLEDEVTKALGKM